LHFNKDYLTDFISSIKRVITTINYDEYNSLPSFLLQPFFNLTNKNFTWYVLSIFIQFFTLVFISFTLFFTSIYNKAFSEEESVRKKHFIFILFSMAFSLLPTIHRPILNGMLDVIDLLYVFIIYFVIVKYDFNKFNLKYILMISASLFLIIITRRYYSFWIVGFYVAMFLYHSIEYLIVKKDWGQALRVLVNIGLSGFFALAALFIFFYRMIEKIINANYSYFYSAYLKGGVFHQLLEIVKDFGWIIIVLALLGYTASIAKGYLRKISIIMIINFIVTVLVFNRVQTMGMHHLYIITPMIVYGLMMFVIAIFKMNFGKKVTKIMVGVFIVLILSNFYVSTRRLSYDNVFVKNFIFGRASVAPVNRDDYDVIEDINNYILSIVNEENKIYIIAASEKYCSETFSNFHLPSLYEKENYYSPVSTVDLTHGFNPSIYTSKYVMTISPAQYHMDLEDERVIGILHDAIENKSIIYDNYELIYENKDVAGVEFKIYKLVSNYTQEQKQYLADEFDKYYSHLPEMFRDRILGN
jgi:hypothetical protein